MSSHPPTRLALRKSKATRRRSLSTPAPTFALMKETDDFPAAAARLRRITTFDLGLFFVTFTCMILMRFGT